MDNNNPTQPAPPTANAAPIDPTAPVQPSVSQTPQSAAAPQTPTSPAPTSEESKKPVLWLIIGLVVVIALVGGIYFFLSRQQAASTAQKATEQPIVQTPQKAPDTVDALDRDLSALNIDNTDADFASVDSDLQQL